MTAKQLLVTLCVAALGELALLGVVVFISEPLRLAGTVARPVPVHLWELAYPALPLLLLAAAAIAPARALLRALREAKASMASEKV